MKQRLATLRNYYLTLVTKYRTAVLFVIGVFFFLKGCVESAPGVQLPQSRYIEQFGEGMEMVYAVVAMAMGLWLMIQHRYIKNKHWFRATHITVFVGFLFQVWVVFVALTSEPPFGILASLAVVVGALLSTIYVLMGVENGSK
jgi:uncharacterized membrane protein